MHCYQVIFKAIINFGVEEEDKKHTWMEDMETVRHCLWFVYIMKMICMKINIYIEKYIYFVAVCSTRGIRMRESCLCARINIS